MKQLKMLWLAVVAAAVVMAYAGAGSASATVLCEEFEIPCPAGKIYPAGTTVSAGLKPEGQSIFRATTGEELEACSMSNLAGSTSNKGAEKEAVKGEILKLSFAECSNAVAAPVLGQFEIEYVTGANNTRANLTFKGTQITINLFGFVDCVYGAGAGLFIGTMTGGEPGTIHVNTVLTKVNGGFLCPTTIYWEAPYEVTAPFPVYFKEK
ncbi:MAG TPA: hypothetical protein VN733_01320 [Solirubrobacterales bacterium]|nr:hypothetical protein [Solirubrobacterales bacterium]